MVLSDNRTVDPLRIEFSGTIPQVDLEKIFPPTAEPSAEIADLAYELFVAWDRLSIGQNLTNLARAAVLIEQADAASGLRLSGSPAEQK